MRRFLLMVLLLALFTAACGTAASDEPDIAEPSAPTVTVFRTPT